MRIRLFVICVLLLSLSPSVSRAIPDGPRTAFPSPPDPLEPRQLPETVEPPGDEPIAIVAGWGLMPSTILHWPLYIQLWEQGYEWGQIHSIYFDYSPLTSQKSPSRNAHHLGRRVEAIAEETGSDVDVISHSLGGLSARWYVEELDGHRHVDDLVTMGTAHRGNYLTYIFYYTGTRDILPGSDFLQNLNDGPVPEDVDYQNVWSLADGFFVNRFNARLPAGMTDQPNVREHDFYFVTHLLMPALTFNTYYEGLD